MGGGGSAPGGGFGDAGSGELGTAGSSGETGGGLEPAPGWEPFSDPVNDGNPDARDPQLAFDAGGTGRAFAVWSAHMDHDDVFVSRFDQGWSEPEKFTPGVASGDHPQVAADGLGNAVAIWRQLEDEYFVIYTSRYAASAGQWGAGQPHLVMGVMDAHAPVISADFDGNMVALWKQDYGSGDGVVDGSVVLAMVLDVTGEVPTWSAPIMLSVGAAARSGSPRLALTSEGDGFAVWDDDYETNRVIYAAKYSKSYGFEPAKKVGFSDFMAADPDVAVTADQNAVAVWRQRGPDGSWGVSSNHFAAITDNWAPANLELSANAAEVGAPRVASNADGAFAIAWWQSDGGKRSLFASRGQLKANGSGQGARGAQIESDERGDAQEPSVVVGKDGTALVAWSQFLGVSDNIVLATHSGDGWRLGTLQGQPARQAVVPVVRFDPQGGSAMALWQELARPTVPAYDILGAAFSVN